MKNINKADTINVFNIIDTTGKVCENYIKQSQQNNDNQDTNSWEKKFELITKTEKLF